MPGKSRKNPPRQDPREKGLGNLNKRVDGFARELEAFRKETAKDFELVRQEMAHGFERQGIALQKQINALADQIAENEKKDAQFRDSMLTAVDALMKNCELFQQEKMALGAGQDRLQQEIDQLKASDQQQNEALRGLEGRVTRLEAA